MKQHLLAILLCIIFLFFPFQVYLIGTDTGIGVQFATFRYQVTAYGNSLIPLTSDAQYVMNGIYSGKTALSILIWILGTFLLASTTIFSMVFAVGKRRDYYNQICLGLIACCVCYLISCMFQYGWMLTGASGRSLPVGIIFLCIWVIILKYYPRLNDFFQSHFPN